MSVISDSPHFKLFPKSYLNKTDSTIVTSCGHSTCELGSFIWLFHVAFSCSLNLHSKPSSGTLIWGGADCCRSCTEEFLQFKNIYLYKYTHSTIEGDLFNFWQYFKITFYFCLFLLKKAGKCCNWEAKRHAYFRGSKHSLRPYLELWQEKDSFWLHMALSNKNTSALYLLENMLISGK